MFKVYVHISPNNKLYIGITCKDVKKRWGANGEGYKGNKYFWNAIQKYGWNNFKHIILFDNLTKEVALIVEEYLIRKYKTYKFSYGYNKAIGGDYGGYGFSFHHTEKTKKQISASKKGISFSESHIQGIKDGWKLRKERGKGAAWNKGIKLKDTGKIDNFIKAGMKNIEDRKVAVQQIDLDTGDVINEFDSIINAARYFNKNYIASIHSVLKGKRRSAFGYGWKYKD